MPDKIKTVKLNLPPDLNFKLIGISSHENDYRLSWALNNALGFSFKKVEDVVVNDPLTHEKKSFICYSFEEEEAFVKYNLISNRCDNGFLIEEFTKIDFILHLSGETQNINLSELIKKIKKADPVLHVFEIELSKLKNKTKIKLIL